MGQGQGGEAVKVAKQYNLESWLCNCRGVASSGQRISISGQTGRGARAASLAAPTPLSFLGSLLRFLAQEAYVSSKKLPQLAPLRRVCISL